MNLLHRARQKYQSDGTLPLLRSMNSLVLKYVTSPFVDYKYSKIDKIRRSELIAESYKNKYIRLDNSRNYPINYPPPFSVDTSGPYVRNLPKYSFEDQYIFEFNDVSLVGPDTIPFTKNNKIICEAIEPSREDGYRVKQALHRAVSDPKTFKSLTYGRKKTRTIDVVCSLNSNWNNYYHWILEHLPKLRAVEAVNQKWGINPTIIIPSDPPSYITESLELIGMSSNEYLEWDMRNMRAKKYIQPTFTEPTKEVCAWLRDRAVSNINQTFQEASDRIYISRKKASKRNVTNEDEIESILKDFGFAIYTTEDLKVPEQVSLFHDADVIVGVHGAGLTDMIWPVNSTIIEIFNNVVKPPYYQIAEELGHDYYPFRGISVGDEGYNSDVYIDPEKFSQFLESTIQ